MILCHVLASPETCTRPSPSACRGNRSGNLLTGVVGLLLRFDASPPRHDAGIVAVGLDIRQVVGSHEAEGTRVGFCLCEEVLRFEGDQAIDFGKDKFAGVERGLGGDVIRW